MVFGGQEPSPMLTLTLISDLHGQLPEDLPPGNLLVVAGDICPVANHKVDFQRRWLETEFNKWVESLPYTYVVMVWGNHDWIGMEKKQPSLHDKVILLTDKSENIEGLHFFGSPWQREYCDWAFNAKESELKQLYSKIPVCDVLISHGPAFGLRDSVGKGAENLGSPSLLKELARIKPKLLVCGHIHPGYGTALHGNTLVVNAAQLNDSYQRVNLPILVDFKGKEIFNVYTA